MLSQMLCPGSHNEGFNETAGTLHVPVDAPSRSPIATTNAPVCVHGFDKLLHVLGNDFTFDRDQHCPGICVRDDSRFCSRRHLPMVPCSEIDGAVGQSQEQP